MENPQLLHMKYRKMVAKIASCRTYADFWSEINWVYTAMAAERTMKFTNNLTICFWPWRMTGHGDWIWDWYGDGDWYCKLQNWGTEDWKLGIGDKRASHRCRVITTMPSCDICRWKLSQSSQQCRQRQQQQQMPHFSLTETWISIQIRLVFGNGL